MSLLGLSLPPPSLENPGLKYRLYILSKTEAQYKWNLMLSESTQMGGLCNDVECIMVMVWTPNLVKFLTVIKGVPNLAWFYLVE